MDFQEEYSPDNLKLEINQAFRNADKWAHDDRLNSIVSDNIIRARFALQTALENLTLTEAEIQQHEREKEKKWEEEQERKWEEKQEEIRENLEMLLDSFEEGERPYKLSYFEAQLVGNVLPECLRGKELSEDVINVLSSLLKEY